jgi:Doubled CXXCH motif (Paired_CXXCH_1)
MRRATLLTLCIFFISAGLAYGGVVDSKHNLSVSGASTIRSTNETQVCIFCHTPHGASANPLWNRNLDSAGYTMYSSPSMNATLPGAPTGISLLCMSCHDGVSAINVLVNYSTVYPITMDQNITKIGDLSYSPSHDPNLTKDLSNDHPVSFTFDTTLANNDGGLHDPGANGANITPLKLYSGKLECATCHDPHEEGTLTGTAPFLRMSNSSSDMCLKCHNK